MTSSESHHIRIPDRLLGKLVGYRWALLGSVSRDAFVWVFLMSVLAFWLVLIADRITDTPVWVRLGLAVAVGVSLVYALVRIVLAAWACRSPLRIAQFMANQDPVLGDHLVGALELADSETEQARSTSLCVAALEQVADEAERHDFREALPGFRTRIGTLALRGLLIVGVGVLLAAPQMVLTTLARLVVPFGQTSRFTFVELPAMIEPQVVPRNERSWWELELGSDSRWVPRSATLDVNGRRLVARLSDQDQSGPHYRFEIPRLIDPAVGRLRVGDATAEIALLPKPRPELIDMVANVRLPDYLSHRGTAGTVKVEPSAGGFAVVEGGTLSLRLTASAKLRHASLDGTAIAVDGDEFTVTAGQGDRGLELQWTDIDGLDAAQPMRVAIRQVPDEQPSLLVQNEGIPERLLDSEALGFTIESRDDFAIQRVGMQWTAGGETGERVLGQGEQQASLSAVFQATALSVTGGETRLRFWVEDDFPGRGRIYSDPVDLNVLSKDEHAVWISGEFAKWRQSALDVRDNELNLFSVNRELAQTDAAERDDRWRAQVAAQARAEEFNARRLDALTAAGEELLRQAARNEAVELEYVEKLAETIKSLEELADEKMPRVADLIKQAAEEEESKFAEMIDQETTQGDLPDDQDGPSGDEASQQEGEQQSERIGLAGTTIVDTSKRGEQEDQPEEKEDPLSLAIEDQTELVAEFDAVAEELKSLLGNMEGSTLVKRLKSVSRLQDKVAMRLGREIEQTFGQPRDTNAEVVQSVVADVADSAARVRTVLDDLDAFCQRRDIEHYASVLEEMKSARVLEQLKTLKDRVASRPGVSISVAEYWADNLDRWADDLVDPGKQDPESGPQNNKSLPPSVIVEVLRILEAEVNLREQTRVAEQGRQTMDRGAYGSEAIRLSEAQDLLRDRLDVVVQSVVAIPDGEVNFGGEIEVLSAASAAMVDAAKTLVSPETGPVAIAAQTEAIELLLRSRKVSPEGGGGGGGGSAGGGQGGETDQAAIALLGRGLNDLAKTRQSETLMATGIEKGDVPEQWRDGLGQYFNQLEQRRARRSQAAPRGEVGQ